ncbi:hypothetical protein ANN_16402 [Periplaneta americana]|uniref:Uncharacterized protein n=1 Tax=Periplaneta americana TaxID=6978 RepID=A0ABQ8SIZ9_PERAM|nr:hypothetical protein ANN_16402 [Periplaneta americana]
MEIVLESVLHPNGQEPEIAEQEADLQQLHCTCTSVWGAILVTHQETGIKVRKMPKKNGKENTRNKPEGQNQKQRVRRRNGVEDVVTIANRMKWRWGGHVVRMQPTRWAHTATLWDPRIGWRNLKYVINYQRFYECHTMASTNDVKRRAIIKYATFINCSGSWVVLGTCPPQASPPQPGVSSDGTLQSASSPQTCTAILIAFEMECSATKRKCRKYLATVFSLRRPPEEKETEKWTKPITTYYDELQIFKSRQPLSVVGSDEGLYRMSAILNCAV